MKEALLFALMSFPCLFPLEVNIDNEEMPCNVTFYSHVDQNAKEIPFTYEAECKLNYLEVEVFNQWGEHIYSTDDVDFEWNGKKVIIDEYGNEEEFALPEGTYYFIAKYKIENDTKIYKQDGNIQVML